MGGYSGPIEITDLVEIVDRNKYRPNIRWLSSRWGSRNGAPAGTCTMLVGDWLTDAWGNLKKGHVSAYNIPTPFIPEKTIFDPKTGRVKARGWRDILTEMVTERIIRPSREIEKLLGEREFTLAKHTAGTLA